MKNCQSITPILCRLERPGRRENERAVGANTDCRADKRDRRSVRLARQASDAGHPELDQRGCDRIRVTWNRSYPNCAGEAGAGRQCTPLGAIGAGSQACILCSCKFFGWKPPVAHASMWARHTIRVARSRGPPPAIGCCAGLPGTALCGSCARPSAGSSPASRATVSGFRVGRLEGGRAGQHRRDPTQGGVDGAAPRSRSASVGSAEVASAA